MAIQRPKPGELTRRSDPPFADTAFVEMYPNLWEYLSLNRWPDGTARQTATLLWFLDGDALKVCINDRDNSRSCFVTAPDFAGIMDAMELGLAGGTLDWRVKGYGGQDKLKTPF